MKFLHFCTSSRVTIILLILCSILCVFGTLLPYKVAVENIYQSLFFFCIFAMFALQLTLTFIYAIIRKEWKKIFLPISFLLILIGGFIGKVWGIKGELGIYEQEFAEYIFDEFHLQKYFQQYDIDKNNTWNKEERLTWEKQFQTTMVELPYPITFQSWFNSLCIAPLEIQQKLGHKLPFQIYLDKFTTEYYNPIPFLHIQIQGTKIKERYNVTKNAHYRIPFSSYEITILPWTNTEIPEQIQIQIHTDNTTHNITLHSKTTIPTLFEQKLSLQYCIETQQRVLAWKSYIQIHDNNNIQETIIAVNQPYKYKGYKIFQSSYETNNNGKNKSILSIANDPGVPIVYLGFFLLMILLILHFCLPCSNNCFYNKNDDEV
ncbi:MAG: cytochrome c biogenesis protein ResB [Planctomycetes bacterium]|nr:cytochrome c biogenesis protein ResB [Planctomycetota bacterium]HPY74031.1 cytochrome c biogenesis protein ResB [Planctomycetota bacterium]